jgi:hypothetical protein
MVALELMEHVVVGHDILKRDLAILEAMVAGMPDYLISDVVSWDMRRGNMPLLTIGGCLMRLNRLSHLQAQLVSDERMALARARSGFNEALRERVVRFEQRAYGELNARLREWTTYMRDLTLSSKLSADRARYATMVDKRVVIGELVDKLSEPPYRLDGRVPRDVAALDRRMRQIWQPGVFVLDEVWQPAYPAERYWWLYGHPKGT